MTTREIDKALGTFPGRLSAAFRAALFPPRCLVCGRFYPRAPRFSAETGVRETAALRWRPVFAAMMAQFLCPGCRHGFTFIESPLCTKCGRMFNSRAGGDHLCGECLAVSRHFGRARSAGVYDRSLMEVIHCFKYGQKVQLASPLSMLLLAALMTHWDREPIDVVAPVPLHRKRLSKRGFNQSGLLIRQCDRLLRAAHQAVPYGRIEGGLLVREKRTAPQTGLGRRQRKRNVKDAFRLHGHLEIDGCHILLVDDVYTTGATVNECARILLRGGAEQVDVLTLARAV